MVSFTLNGAPFSIDVPIETPLIDIIRDHARMTGTKQACGAGVCGACTVQVDGHAVVSCLMPAVHVQGKAVVTVEGIGRDKLHPIQKAFMAEDALQCGFCTPGFVVAAAAFHDAWRAKHGVTQPAETDIAAALAGHLCRCGAYPGIYRAVAAACAGRHDSDALTSPRYEAHDKVTGAAKYTVDKHQDGQLYGLVLRSPHGHADVVSIDVKSALGVPGVKAAVSLLGSDNTVRHVGQAVAAVAAIDRLSAEQGLTAIRVTYKTKPVITSSRSARSKDSPRLYSGFIKNAVNSAEGPVLPMPWSGNMRGPAAAFSLSKGRAKSELAAAATRRDPLLVTGTYRNAGQSHTCLEPHAAVIDHQGGKIVAYLSSQAVQFAAGQIAKKAGVKDVTAYAEHVGGGFGSKVSFGIEGQIALALSKAAGKPVRIAYDRAEELSVAGHRPETEIEVKLLPTKDGKLGALSVRTYSNAGVAINSTVSGLARLVYTAGSKELVDWDVVTNTPPGSPFRAPGGPPLCFALEQAIDEAAEKLATDPIALRQRWDEEPNRQRLYSWAKGLDVWRQRGDAGRETGRYRRGIGVAAGNWLYFVQSNTEVEIGVRAGKLFVACGTQDIGQGSRTLLAETVATAFSVPASSIEIDMGRSDLPTGPMAAGSRSTASLVPAIDAAAEMLKGRLRPGPRGSPGDNVPWSDIIAGAGDVRVKSGRPPDSTTINPNMPHPLKAVGFIGTAFDWMLRNFAHIDTGRGVAGAVQIADVEVDTWLGKIRVRRFYSGLTVGKPRLRRLAENQAEGSIIQGIGYALYEAREYDPLNGNVLSAGLDDYRIPGIGDTPEMHLHFDEQGFEHVPGGAVGIGEIATLPVAAAIANAVYNATGVRPYEAPIRPDRLLAGLAGLQKSRRA
jgi:xanthine dehydrogenase YagR molybdenum-binding subunit